MEERASRLLSYSDDVLFAHGGCHVFALALKSFSGLPLVRIHSPHVNHDHVACDGGNRRLVDFFGWCSHSDYCLSERLDIHTINFDAIEDAQLTSRFIRGPGPGYYSHPDFFDTAFSRANGWISQHLDIFNGSSKIAIAGLQRTKKATNNQIESIFDAKA